MLSAYGNRHLENETALATNLLELSYYLQLQMKRALPDLELAVFKPTKQDLAQGLSALGQGGESHSLVQKNGEWSYFYQEGGYGGTSWRRAESAPNGWKEGNAPLGYGDGDETTTIEYGSDEDNKPITAYFRKTFDVEDVGHFDLLSLRVLHDDGMVAYLNGQEVARNNMPAGSVQAGTLAPKGRSSDEENVYWQVAISAKYLKPGTNVIAVEVHQNKADSSDLGFDLELASEALSTAEIVKEVETGVVMEALGEWKKRLPTNLVPMVKMLAKANTGEELAEPAKK